MVAGHKKRKDAVMKKQANVVYGLIAGLAIMPLLHRGSRAIYTTNPSTGC
jgi:hypothetical protein